MEKKEFSTELRLLLAFALSFAVVMLSRYLLPKPATPPVKTQQTTKQTPPPTAPTSASPAAAQETQSVSAEPPPAAPGTKLGSSEQTVTVDSDLYHIVFSSRGALVKSWLLKRFRDEKGGSLDVVDQDAAHQYGFPLSIWTGDPALRDQINNALFVPSATGTVTAPASLTFEYSNGPIAARKEITFTGKDYILEIKTDVWKDGQPVAHGIAWRGGFGDIHDIGMRGNVVDVYFRDAQKIARHTSGDIKTGELTDSGAFEYVGIEDRFFAATFLPYTGTTRLTSFRQDVTVAGQTKPRPSVGFAVQSTDSPRTICGCLWVPKTHLCSHP